MSYFRGIQSGNYPQYEGSMFSYENAKILGHYYRATICLSVPLKLYFIIAIMAIFSHDIAVTGAAIIIFFIPNDIFINIMTVDIVNIS